MVRRNRSKRKTVSAKLLPECEEFFVRQAVSPASRPDHDTGRFINDFHLKRRIRVRRPENTPIRYNLCQVLPDFGKRKRLGLGAEPLRHVLGLQVLGVPRLRPPRVDENRDWYTIQVLLHQWTYLRVEVELPVPTSERRHRNREKPSFGIALGQLLKTGFDVLDS